MPGSGRAAVAVRRASCHPTARHKARCLVAYLACDPIEFAAEQPVEPRPPIALRARQVNPPLCAGHRGQHRVQLRNGREDRDEVPAAGWGPLVDQHDRPLCRCGLSAREAGELPGQDRPLVFNARCRLHLASLPSRRVSQARPAPPSGSAAAVASIWAEGLHAHRDRSAEAIDAGGVLPGYSGIIVRDRYHGYTSFTAVSRQVAEAC